jgi:hypothetical protein
VPPISSVRGGYVLLDLPLQQTTAVAGDRSAVELRPDLASLLWS